MLLITNKSESFLLRHDNKVNSYSFPFLENTFQVFTGFKGWTTMVSASRQRGRCMQNGLFSHHVGRHSHWSTPLYSIKAFSPFSPSPSSRIGCLWHAILYKRTLVLLHCSPFQYCKCDLVTFFVSLNSTEMSHLLMVALSSHYRFPFAIDLLRSLEKKKN